MKKSHLSSKSHDSSIAWSMCYPQTASLSPYLVLAPLFTSMFAYLVR